jgi:hypothetical protein
VQGTAYSWWTALMWWSPLIFSLGGIAFGLSQAIRGVPRSAAAAAALSILAGLLACGLIVGLEWLLPPVQRMDSSGFVWTGVTLAALLVTLVLQARWRRLPLFRAAMALACSAVVLVCVVWYYAILIGCRFGCSI